MKLKCLKCKMAMKHKVQYPFGRNSKPRRIWYCKECKRRMLKTINS